MKGFMHDGFKRIRHSFLLKTTVYIKKTSAQISVNTDCLIL